MNNQTPDKRRAAAYLFDEIGMLDERTISEAMSFRPAGLRRRKVLLVAAAMLTLVIVMIPLSALLLRSDKNSESDLPDRGDYLIFESGELSDSVDLFEGRARLIWQNPGEQGYRSVELSQSEYNTMIEKLSEGSRPVSEQTVDTPRIWLARWDGMVISPYLKPSLGNIAVGELFDYSPELDISYEADEFIRHLIAKNT